MGRFDPRAISLPQNGCALRNLDRGWYGKREQEQALGNAIKLSIRLGQIIVRGTYLWFSPAEKDKKSDQINANFTFKLKLHYDGGL